MIMRRVLYDWVKGCASRQRRKEEKERGRIR
jgi:hypothetical protein